MTEDADLDAVLPAAVNGFLTNNGQTCAALTRLIVPRSRLAEVEDRLVAEVERRVVGDPTQESTAVGPLVSARQRESVLDYVRHGIENHRLIVGGADRPDGLERGHYVVPTIFSDVDPDARIAQEEIFGPVLAMIPYDDEDEAVRIANDTIYGLAGGVWGSDPEHAKRVARRIRTGQVEINGATFNPYAPFGGYKQSGHGRELGRFGLEEFLETKSLQL